MNTSSVIISALSMLIVWHFVTEHGPKAVMHETREQVIACYAEDSQFVKWSNKAH